MDIDTFISQLNAYKPNELPPNLASYLEQRGRNCISKSMKAKAVDASRDAVDDRDFLSRLQKKVPMLRIEDNKVYMVYPKCYCHHVRNYKGDIPDSYCNCSVFWVREMFENALKRKIEVKLISSIIRGDKECRLQILL